MFEKYDKRRLYWLMEQYLLNKISARVFCDEFYYCYDLELNADTLTPQELKIFRAVSIVANRFCEYEEELEKYPGVYFSEKQLKQKVLKVKALMDNP